MLCWEVACFFLCKERGTKERAARGPAVYKPVPGAAGATLPALFHRKLL